MYKFGQLIVTISEIPIVTLSSFRGTGKAAKGKKNNLPQASSVLDSTTSLRRPVNARATWIRAPAGTRRNVGTDARRAERRAPQLIVGGGGATVGFPEVSAADD